MKLEKVEPDKDARSIYQNLGEKDERFKIASEKNHQTGTGQYSCLNSNAKEEDREKKGSLIGKTLIKARKGVRYTMFNACSARRKDNKQKRR